MAFRPSSSLPAFRERARERAACVCAVQSRARLCGDHSRACLRPVPPRAQRTHVLARLKLLRGRCAVQTVLNAAKDPDFVQFDRETAIQARISHHPNIVAYKGVCKVT